MNTEPTRREFVGTAAAVAAGVASWTGGRLYAAEAGARPGPNETVNMGLIGCGNRGAGNLLPEFRAVPGVRIIGVCDLNGLRMAQARNAAGGQSVLEYHDYRKLLENKDVDAVIVATNDHWHVLPTIQACQAGKDVFVEKPLGTSIGEGRAAVEAAKKYDRVVQIGTNQRSCEQFRRAAKIIRSGLLGEISEVKVWDYVYTYPGFGSPPDCDPPKELDWDFWVGPSPQQPYNLNKVKQSHWFFDFGGGWQVDWAVHNYDIVNWCMGVTEPISAVAMGGFLCFKNTNTQWPDTFSGICEYGPGPVAKKGFLMQYTYRGGCRREHRAHGILFFGTEASMILDRGGYTISAESRGGKKLGERIESFRDESCFGETASASKKHVQLFSDNVRAHKKPFADVEAGHHASNPGHLMNIAWKVGRKIHWDGQKEQVVGDEEGNALVTKKYRAPLTLEV